MIDYDSSDLLWVLILNQIHPKLFRDWLMMEDHDAWWWFVTIMDNIYHYHCWGMFIIDHYPFEPLFYRNPGYNHGLSVGVAIIGLYHASLNHQLPINKYGEAWLIIVVHQDCLQPFLGLKRVVIYEQAYVIINQLWLHWCGCRLDVQSLHSTLLVMIIPYPWP